MLKAAIRIVVLAAAVGPALWAQDGRLTQPILQGGIPIALETVATGLTAPNWGTTSPLDDQHLLVSDQAGILWAINLATGEKVVALDVREAIVELGVFGTRFDERGLLGVAFPPDSGTDFRFLTYTSEPADGPADFSTLPEGTDPDHQSVVREWHVQPDGTQVDRVVLRIDEPQFNHNAGGLAFGPDGMLYISVGDGGGADDEGEGHSGVGNGQDPSNVLGTVLRIDPAGRSSANGQYAVPADNPFAGIDATGGQAGCADGHCDEIFAYGFRNPFRLSFDRQRGDLYLGDVGQNNVEEIDVVVAGGNYGWRWKEGTFCFDPNGEESGFAFAADPCPGVPAGAELIDPVAEYENGVDGVSAIAGFVYRGSAIPELQGYLVFGDFSQVFDFGNNIFNKGRLFHLADPEVAANGIDTSRVVEFTLTELDGEPISELNLSLLGFAEDADGELYVLGNEVGVPFEETGVVLKIVPPRAGPLPPVGCTPSRTTLCLLDRFAVEMTWTDFEGQSGPGFATSLTAESGTFYFFNSGNVEVTAKMLDGRGINGFYWYFFASMTNVEFTMTVTDTANGASRTFTNPLGTFASGADLSIFP